MPFLPANIELHVIGNKEEVVKALRDHEINPGVLLEIREKDGFCEVLAKVECKSSVENWFSESIPITNPGCLVMYTL